MTFSFNKSQQKEIQKILSHYPKGRERSAILPILDLAQRQNGGWISQEAIEVVASLLNLTPLAVLEVATFYTMFNLSPGGKHHIQMCRTLPCGLRGADKVRQVCEKRLGLQPGESNEDFRLSEVECLGACVGGPVVQIDDDYYENVTPEIMEALIDRYAQS